MSYDLLKTGSCSVILGEKHYSNFFTTKKGALLKVTKLLSKHNELKHLDKVREIKDYDKYYTIPYREIIEIKKSDPFHFYLSRLVMYENMNIFDNNLHCFSIDHAGDNDMLDIIDEMGIKSNNLFWKSYKDIVRFARHILRGLNFLHQKELAHLDIKPENIMVNRETKQFKIIDFGFTQKYPFEEYIDSPRGTPGYFPRHFDFEKPNRWLPKIRANDFDKEDGEIIVKREPELIYKVDSYCFGRVLYFLREVFQDNKAIQCCNWNFNRRVKDNLDILIVSLLENDVRLRLTPGECLELLDD